MTFVARMIVCLAVLFGTCASAAPQDVKDREFKECTVCPVMLGIPAGTFTMGSPTDEAGRFESEGPQHRVAVPAFALGKYDVTSEEFLLFLKDTGYRPALCDPVLRMGWRVPEIGRAYPPYDTEPPKWPAVCLDWKDAVAYVAWLNAAVRKERPALAGRDGPYRLPSEAEWEYAARAGSTTARWWGDDLGSGHTNCNGCGSKFDNRYLAEVDDFAPNPFGLYGMLGNAWQWTADCWHDSFVGAPPDGSAWTAGDCTRHVMRGGAWNNLPIFVRSAARNASTSNDKEWDYSSLSGFRIARTLP